MNAIEFVKECGIDAAKRTLNNAIGFGCAEIELFAGKYVFRTDDLKQIVDAWELVEKYKNRHGGIRFRIRWGMFRYGDTQEFNDRLKQAINLVERCQ